MNDVTLDADAMTALAEFRGTPEQATAALAQRKASYDAAQLGPPPPAASSASARLQLDRLSRDGEFQSKLNVGNPEAVKLFRDLCSAVASGDATADALAPAPEPPGDHIETVTTGQLSQSALRREVEGLRSMGFGDAVIKQMIDGQPVSAAERQMAVQLRAQLLGNQDYARRYLSGDVACRIEQTLLATLIASEVAT
jgi:hypothetical protein